MIDNLTAALTRYRSTMPFHRVSVVVVALVMAGTHLWQAGRFHWPSGQFKNLHLGLALILVFLSLVETKQNRVTRGLLYGLAALALVPLLYIHIEYQGLVSERTFGPAGWDVTITLLLLAVTLTAAVLQWGWTLPTISGAALLYGYFGKFMPGELLFHAGIGLERLMSYTAIPFFQGLLGSLTGLSATLVFIFMLYAGLLKATGGIRFVMVLGRVIGGRSRSGPAQVAVVASGFMGMISGSTVGNVASTGAMTIPMMKRHGYSAEHAGAVEAVASTGGQFAPPVMGLTAFLIVGMTGITYNRIMLAAILPALVYYGYLMAAVHLQAVAGSVGRGSHTGPADPEDDISLGAAARQYGHLLLSIVVLIYLLLIKLPPAFSALYAMGVIVATETGKQLLVQRRKPFTAVATSVGTILRGLEQGARSGAQLAIIIATIGILVDILVVTGFAQKLSHLMLNVAGGNLLILLILAAFTSLVFGLGMPTPAAYILVALLGAPALVEFGVPLLAAHMFVFYFANMSAITPPVAVAALVAAKLAQANYLKTAVAALRLGLPGFVLPFMFVYAPEILLLEGTLLTQMLAFVAILLAVVSVNALLLRHALVRLTFVEMAALVFSIGMILHPALATTVVGVVAIAGVIARQYLAVRRLGSASGLYPRRKIGISQ